MPGNELVQSLSRGLEVLEFAARSGGAIKVVEVSSELGLKASTVRNLMRTLESRGYLEKLGSSLGYRLGSAFFTITEGVFDSSLRRRVGGIMLGLSEKFPKAVVVYSVVMGNRVQAKYRISPDCPDYVMEPADRFMGLYSSASGLSALAFADEATVMDLRENRPFHEHGAHLWGNAANLADFLEESCVKGWVATPFEGQEVFRVSCPLFAGEFREFSSIGICIGKRFAEAPGFEKEIARELLESAAGIYD